MSITVACECGRKFRAKEEHAGKRAKCPICGRIFIIPQNEVQIHIRSTDVHEKRHKWRIFSRAYIITGLVISVVLCIVVLLINKQFRDRHERESLMLLNTALDQAIAQANVDADSFQFDAALKHLRDAADKISESPYCDKIKERLEQARTHVRESQKIHSRKLQDGYIVYKGKLVAGPPVKLVVGQPLPVSFRCIFIGHPSNFVMLIKDSTLYCRYLQLMSPGTNACQYEVWPLNPGELRICLSEKKPGKNEAKVQSVNSAPGLPEYGANLWIEQPYEIRDLAGKVIYRFPPDAKREGLYTKSGDEIYVVLRWLNVNSILDLLDYPIVPGQKLLLGPHGSFMGVYTDMAQKEFEGLDVLVAMFENRTSRTIKVAIPRPDEVVIGADRARGIYVGPILKDMPFIKSISGSLYTTISSKDYAEVIFLVPADARASRISLGEYGEVTLTAVLLHRELADKPRHP